MFTEWYMCNDCGAITKGETDLGRVICGSCKSEDVEEMRECERCGELTLNTICDDCKREVDEIISNAIAEVENAPNSRLDYVTARDIFLERIEELE